MRAMDVRAPAPMWIQPRGGKRASYRDYRCQPIRSYAYGRPALLSSNISVRATCERAEARLAKRAACSLWHKQTQANHGTVSAATPDPVEPEPEREHPVYCSGAPRPAPLQVLPTRAHPDAYGRARRARKMSVRDRAQRSAIRSLHPETTRQESSARWLRNCSQ